MEAELKAVQEQRRTEELLFKLKNMTPSNYGKEAGVEDQVSILGIRLPGELLCVPFQ